MPGFKTEDMARWSGGEWVNGSPAAIAGVSHDTRTLIPGNLFFAIPGERFDGSQFVEQALAKGAAGAVVSREQRDRLGSCPHLLCVQDVLCALGDMARGYRQTWQARVVGVTGSVGKTTVKEMIADMLAVKQSTARSPGNWNNNIGLPLSMLGLEPDSDYGVFEIGMNHPGELEPLCEILQPACGVITTIGPVHLEFFEGVEDIAREKAMLARAIPQDGFVVLSRDEDWFPLLESAASCRIVTVSLQGDQEAHYAQIPPGREDGVLIVKERETGIVSEYPLSLPGEYLMDNALRALAVCREWGVHPAEIAKALARYKPLKMRWSRESIGGVDFINDAYNANPVSMRAALRTFERLPCDGGKWLVLGGMRELGASSGEKHRSVGNDIAYGTWQGLIVLGEGGERIADGAEQEGFEKQFIVRCTSIDEIAGTLAEKVKEGDAVLLKASRGEELERVIDAYRKVRGIPEDS